jgi:hypothetical protein
MMVNEEEQSRKWTKPLLIPQGVAKELTGKTHTRQPFSRPNISTNSWILSFNHFVTLLPKCVSSTSHGSLAHTLFNNGISTKEIV